MVKDLAWIRTSNFNPASSPNIKRGPRVENFGIYSVPDTKYWVTAISVTKSLDRSIIQTRLMCDCMPNTKIVVLKLDKSEEGPPTFDVAEAEAYVTAIVRNAHNCETMYGMGQKLAE